MKYLPALLAGALLAWCGQAVAEESPAAPPVQVLKDTAYKTGSDLTGYEKERCKLDLYLPPGQKDFPTLVWYHGGGLEGGDKNSAGAMARSLAEAGIAVASVEYRLSPKAKYPSYIQDAAAAFAWTRAHIAEYGGDPRRVFVGGHSAGAYLALMVGLDEQYLKAAGGDLSQVAGVIPISGQTMTHNTVRKERGIGMWTITADEAAPVYYCRKDTPPVLLLYADHDMPARAEENEYLLAAMKAAGNQNITGHLIRNRNHGTIAGDIVNPDDPARLLILHFIQTEPKSN
jgi:acetyl esterase/lipase